MSFFYGASSDHPDAWHAQRRQLVTASEIARLAHSGRSGWLALKREKETGERWAGNQYTQWGHYREPIIAKRMTANYPWLMPNKRVVIQENDQRWGATPDMVGESHLQLCQIKTSMKRLSKPPAAYYDQCQWEMWVTGFDSNILVVEYYEEEFGKLWVADEQLDEFEIARDDTRISELVEIAEAFLAMSQPSLLDRYIADYAAVVSQEQAVKESKDEVRRLANKEIGDRDTFKYVSDAGSVTKIAEKTREVEVFDLDRFKVDHPDLAGEYMTTETKTIPGRLTITPAKETA